MNLTCTPTHSNILGHNVDIDTYVDKMLRETHTHVRGVIGVSIGRGEVKFVFLILAFESTLGGQVCNFVLVPEKTD